MLAKTAINKLNKKGYEIEEKREGRYIRARKKGKDTIEIRSDRSGVIGYIGEILNENLAPLDGEIERQQHPNLKSIIG